MSKIEKFVIGKGTTRKIKGTENDYDRKYLELTLRLPEQYTEEGFHEAVIHAEYLIDNWLEQPTTPQIPQFNPDDLMKHSWKGKKIAEGEYAKGSLAWGWDWKANFKPDTIKALEKDSVTIDKYEFTMTDKIVQAKKKAVT